jgi:hypothetical protein
MSALSYLRYRDRRWTMTELIFATAVIVDATGQPDGTVGRGGRDTADVRHLPWPSPTSKRP